MQVTTYKVKAKVLIEIETDFKDTEEPTADTIKFCVDEDIAEERDISGAMPDCEVVEFEIVDKIMMNENCTNR